MKLRSGSETLAVESVELSDGTVLQGDDCPKLSVVDGLNLISDRHKKAQSKVAARVHSLFDDVLRRRLTIDDASVLMTRALQEENVDGTLATLLVLVGMRLGPKLMGKSRKGKGKVPDDMRAEYLAMVDHPSKKATDVAAKMQLRGVDITRQAVSNRRKARATKR